MNENSTIHVARNGEVIGSWPVSQIRYLIGSNQLQLDDLYCDEVEQVWRPILPPPKRRTLVFDWGGEDDKLWYYIKDGFMHGPRGSEEMEALYQAKLIKDSTLLCVWGANDWFTYESLFKPKKSGKEKEQAYLPSSQPVLKKANVWEYVLQFVPPALSRQTFRSPFEKTKQVLPLPAQPSPTDAVETSEAVGEVAEPVVALISFESHDMKKGVCIKCGCSESYIKSHNSNCRKTAAPKSSSPLG